MNGSLRILQLTDTHLYADAAGRLLGMNTLDSLRRVIDAALAWQPFDFVLATGDLVHDASAAGYRSLVRELTRLNAPVYCLPGNHDESAALAAYVQYQNVTAPKRIDRGDWRVVLLDSTIAGEDGGRLPHSELALLERALHERDRYVLVCLHHQPVAVGSAWMDRMALENAEAFFGIIDAKPQVRGILWGHVHQEFDRQHAGLRLMASPSTCVQFAPGTGEFQVDNRPPGFRLLELLPNGTIHTQILRLDEVPAGLDAASVGY